MPDSTTPTRPRRRWFCFSLRSLLLFTVLVGLLMGWIAKERTQSQRELAIAKMLETWGCEVQLAGPFDLLYEEPEWWRRFVSRLLGRRILRFQTRGIVLDRLPLTALGNLQRLDVYNSEGVDLAPLAHITTLKDLDLSTTDVSDLKPLADLKNLERLWLVKTQVRDLTPLAATRSLKFLDVSSTPTTDLTPMTKLLNLTELHVKKTEIGRQQVDALQRALPNCKIYHDPFP